MSVTEIIAGQLHHTKPAHLRPGADVGMTEIDEFTLGLVINPSERIAVIRYLPGPDEYAVAVGVRPRAGKDVLAALAALAAALDLDDPETADVCSRAYPGGMYADQIGELVWGDAQPFTMPLVEITDLDGNPLED